MTEPINIDLTGVSTTLEAIPEGYYDIVVQECHQKSSEAGNPYLAWVFQVQGGEFDGRKLFHNTSLLPQSLWNLKGTLIAFGWPAAELDQAIQFDPDDAVGCTATASVIQESTPEYGTRNRVRRIVAAGSVVAGEGETLF